MSTNVSSDDDDNWSSKYHCDGDDIDSDGLDDNFSPDVSQKNASSSSSSPFPKENLGFQMNAETEENHENSNVNMNSSDSILPMKTSTSPESSGAFTQEITLEVETLRLRVRQLENLVNSDDKATELLQLRDENSYLKDSLANAKFQTEVHREIIHNIQSQTSKRDRVRDKMKSNKVDTRSIRDTCHARIFPQIKFFHKDHLITVGDNSIASIIMMDLGIHRNLWATWWASHHETVEELLVEHRSKVSQNMKHSFFEGKNLLPIFLDSLLKISSLNYCTAVFRFANDTSEDDQLKCFLQLIKNSASSQSTNAFYVSTIHSNVEHYYVFVRLFGKCVQPYSEFMKIVKNPDLDLFEEKFTIQDEALAMTIFEGNFDKWNAESIHRMASNPASAKAMKSLTIPKHVKKTFPKSLYTDSDTTTNLRSGWNREGIDTFAMYVKDVKKFRTSQQFQTSKKRTVELMKTMCNQGKRKASAIDQAEEARKFDDCLLDIYKESKFASL